MRTGLPLSTAIRMAQTLAKLRYLTYDAVQRKYFLAPAVLALGYGAIADSDVQRAASVHMRTFADRHRVHVSLATRDRLDVVVLESCSSFSASLSLSLHPGIRIDIASSPLGWALLAALPELERHYLLEHAARRSPRGWPRVRRRLLDAIAQVQALGFCTSLGEWDPDLGIVAAPLVVPGHSPLVLGCVGASAQMTRAGVERELGPRLLAMTGAIEHEASPE